MSHEPLSLLNSLLPPGSVADADLRRHSVARWLVLTSALVYRDISVKVRKRFPSIQHLVQAELMTAKEKELYLASSEAVRWFLPIQWCQKTVQEVAKEAGIPPPALNSYYASLGKVRANFRSLFCYDWVCIPLVYTQVAALATYGFFSFCLIGRQFLDPTKKIRGQEIDLYFPIFTVVQFLFFVGWFKVGQDLMRPFGTDDDDIELSYILDRHINAAFAIVNPIYSTQPALVEDRFWQEPGAKLPHTKISSILPDHPPKLHAYVKLRSGSDADIQTISGPTSVKEERRENRKHWRHF